MGALRKRVFLLLDLLLCVLLLSGCSFSDLMSWGTGVKQDPDYQTWEKLSEKGKLDQEGKYTADAIHVTFAENSFFSMKYYRDQEMKDELPTEGCYLLPGDLIYCTADVRGDAANYYEFNHLDVIEYTADNTRNKKLNWQYQDKGMALLVPFDYKGTEVSIEPAGQYRLFTVRLEQPEMGGHVTYQYNKKDLIGETVELFRGAKIRGLLESDSGWETPLTPNPEYTVTEEENQVVTFEGKRANDFFVESESHKPLLKLEANQNLNNTRMTIETWDYTNDVTAKKGGGVIIDNQRIGTGKGIKVQFPYFDLGKGNNAVRLTVMKKAKNNEYKEIHYASETNSTVQIDLEYQINYENISILAEAVSVMELPSIQDEGVTIETHFSDQTLDNKKHDVPLTPGNQGTNDRRIKVRITPNQGYSLDGAFVGNGVYERDMRFDEYERFVNEVLRNQVKKYCKIILDSSDPYGKVEFKYEGKVISGESEIKEGSSFSISYELTDEKYEIDEERNVIDQFTMLIGSNNGTKYEKTVSVTRDMDGTTINRESCIKLKLREKVN